MSIDYVTKFGYRKYEGRKESRLRRIWSLAIFEMTSTWRKSTLGKILLVLLVVINSLTAIAVISAGSFFFDVIPVD